MTEIKRVRFALCLLITCLFAGCQDSRIGLNGNVKVDGTPLTKGYIIFLPESGTSGPTAGADIVDGAYEIEPAKGVFEGSFKVEIKGWRDSQTVVEDSVTGETFAEPEQFIPLKYNKESELNVKISKDKTVQDFDLELPESG